MERGERRASPALRCPVAALGICGGRTEGGEGASSAAESGEPGRVSELGKLPRAQPVPRSLRRTALLGARPAPPFLRPTAPRSPKWPAGLLLPDSVGPLRAGQAPPHPLRPTASLPEPARRKVGKRAARQPTSGRGLRPRGFWLGWSPSAEKPPERERVGAPASRSPSNLPVAKVGPEGREGLRRLRRFSRENLSSAQGISRPSFPDQLLPAFS